MSVVSLVKCPKCMGDSIVDGFHELRGKRVVCPHCTHSHSFVRAMKINWPKVRARRRKEIEAAISADIERITRRA